MKDQRKTADPPGCDELTHKADTRLVEDLSHLSSQVARHLSSPVSDQLCGDVSSELLSGLSIEVDLLVL